MDLKLRPETVKRIEERMRDGRYPSADDVVEAGLTLLEERDLHRVRTSIAEGLGQARRGELIDGDEALAARRRRREEQRQKAG